jgi:hypothetical protein
MGRRPIGARAMTPAEKMRRYRARKYGNKPRVTKSSIDLDVVLIVDELEEHLAQAHKRIAEHCEHIENAHKRIAERDEYIDRLHQRIAKLEAAASARATKRGEGQLTRSRRRG